MARAVGEPRWQDAEGVYEYVVHESVTVRYLLGRDGQHRSYVHTLDLKGDQALPGGRCFFVATLIRKEVRPFTIKQIELAARDQTQTASSRQNT